MHASKSAPAQRCSTRQNVPSITYATHRHHGREQDSAAWAQRGKSKKLGRRGRIVVVVVVVVGTGKWQPTMYATTRRRKIVNEQANTRQRNE